MTVQFVRYSKNKMSPFWKNYCFNLFVGWYDFEDDGITMKELPYKEFKNSGPVLQSTEIYIGSKCDVVIISLKIKHF